MHTVLLLTGQTMGDALGASGRALRTTFEELGFEFVEINLSSQDAMDKLGRLVLAANPISFVLSHVGIGMDLMGKGSDGREMNLWAGNRVPFISFYGDSPAYFFDRHVVPGDNFACLYAFPEHLEYRKSLPAKRGLLGATPLRLIDDTPIEVIDFRAKESGKLLFLKNGNDPQRLISMWRDRLPPALHIPLMDLAAALVGTLSRVQVENIDQAVRTHFDQMGIDIVTANGLRLFFVAQLDDYLRRVKSTTMAKILREFPVEIHGYNWEHVDFSGGRATFVAGADYTASRSRIAQALGVIDMSPNTTAGPHDRVLRALGLHTLFVTNRQAFFDTQLPEAEPLTFEFADDSLRHRVERILANPRQHVELGIEVSRRFRQRFDSTQFGPRIVDIASMLGTACSANPPRIQDFFVWPTKPLH